LAVTFETCQTLSEGRRGPVVIDHRAASAVRATFADPADRLCDATTCPTVVDRVVVYHDFSGHFTAPLALSFADTWAAALGLAGP
jgi:hypothetical protein